MSECQMKPCNQEAGHSGRHGIVLSPGLILVPHGGDEGTISDAVPVDLKCDCCGGAMLMRRYEHGGGSFECQSCEQRHDFSSDGRSGCKILARLYPSEMDERSELYREFLAYRLSSAEFGLHAKRLCGLISPEEEQHHIDEWKELVAAKQREIPALPVIPEKRHWWKFWAA